jgi:hypothetical protein
MVKNSNCDLDVEKLLSHAKRQTINISVAETEFDQQIEPVPYLSIFFGKLIIFL